MKSLSIILLISICFIDTDSFIVVEKKDVQTGQNSPIAVNAYAQPSQYQPNDYVKTNQVEYATPGQVQIYYIIQTKTEETTTPNTPYTTTTPETPEETTTPTTPKKTMDELVDQMKTLNFLPFYPYKKKYYNYYKHY